MMMIWKKTNPAKRCNKSYFSPYPKMVKWRIIQLIENERLFTMGELMLKLKEYEGGIKKVE